MYFSFCDGMFSQHYPLQCNKKGPPDTEAENLHSISLKWYLDSIQ